MHQTLLLWKSRSPKGICKRKRERGWWEAFLPLLFCRPLPPENDPNADDYFLPPFAHNLPSSGWSKLVTLISFQHARWWTDKSWRRCEAFFLLGKSSKSHSQYEVPFATAISTKVSFSCCRGGGRLSSLYWRRQPTFDVAAFSFFATAAKCLLGPYRIVCTLYLRRHQWRTFWESFTLYRLWKRLLLPVFNFLIKSHWMFHLSEYIL